jgi:hypothetical protein
MAKNTSGVDKAMLDRLAAEFREELNNLGVRVANLEKHADMVQWKGKLEYTATSERLGGNKGVEKGKNKSNGYVFRLEPKAEVNDHWTVNARLDAEGDLKHDTTTAVRLKRAWAQGDYDKFQIKLGRMEFYTPEHGLIFDSEFSGAQVSYGDKWKFTAMGGRLASDKINSNPWNVPVMKDALDKTFAKAGVPNLGPNAPRTYNPQHEYDDYDPSSFWGINVQYDEGGKGLFGGLGYYYLKDEDLRSAFYTKTVVRNGQYVGLDGGTNKASILSANLGYRFNEKAKLWADYARNSKADYEKTSWQAIFDYGDYNNAQKKGSWDVYIGYRKYGFNTSFLPTQDDALRGTKGFVIGAAYAPFKNVGLLVKYFKGKTVSDGLDASKVFGRVEWFF